MQLPTPSIKIDHDRLEGRGHRQVSRMGIGSCTFLSRCGGREVHGVMCDRIGKDTGDKVDVDSPHNSEA